MKFVILFSLIFVLLKICADDSSETLSECPNFKPMENFDTKSVFEGRWYFLKSTYIDSTTGKCSYIDFNNEADDEYEIFSSTEYNGIAVHNVQYWMSTKPGELILNTTVKSLTSLGMKITRVYHKVRIFI